MILLESTSRPVSEDCVRAGKNWMFVLDGASGLEKDYLGLDISDAAWFVRRLAYQIEQHMDENLTLEQILEKAVLPLQNAFAGCPDERLCSCTASIVRMNHEKLEYLVLGDSPVYIKTHRETLRFADDSIAGLDDQVIALMMQIAKETGDPFLSGRQQSSVKELLIQNRMLKNQPFGYAICDSTLRWKERCLHGSLPLDFVEAAAIMSDGFEQLRYFAGWNTASFMDHILQSPFSCFEQLQKYQKEDSECLKLPRLKQADDTSLVVFDLR